MADLFNDEEKVHKLKQENRLLRISVSSLVVAGACFGLYSLQGSVPEVATAEKELDTPVIVPDENLAERREPVVPVRFDSRDEWYGCARFVVDQGQCGDCWAASATNTLGDRVCIHLTAEGKAVPLSHAGSKGSGVLERAFQQAGVCIGNGTMGMAHEHGCRRGQFFLSPQPLVSCASHMSTKPPTYHPFTKEDGYEYGMTLYPSSSGCNGGTAEDAWRFFYHEGLSNMDGTQSAGCTPYTSHLCSFDDPFANGCHKCDFSQCADNGLPPKVYNLHSFGWIMEKDLSAHYRNVSSEYRPKHEMAAMARQVRKMQIEMMTNGPLHTCIDDFANFAIFYNLYPQGVYNTTEGTPCVGGHCIELIGWGLDAASRLPFWTWKNSWGTNFANGGYARFIRGVDLGGIESDVWAGCPTGSYCKLTEGVVPWEGVIPKQPNFPIPPGKFRTTTTVKPHHHHPTPPPRRLSSSSTSASMPSREWHGGDELELTRKDFSHPSVAPIVIKAVREALNNYGLTDADALAKAQRVWTRSVRGLRARVQVEGVDKHRIGIRHMEGHLTVQ